MVTVGACAGQLESAKPCIECLRSGEHVVDNGAEIPVTRPLGPSGRVGVPAPRA